MPWAAHKRLERGGGRERQLCIAYMYSLNLDVHTHMPACSLIGGTVHIYAVLEYQV